MPERHHHRRRGARICGPGLVRSAMTECRFFQKQGKPTGPGSRSFSMMVSMRWCYDHYASYRQWDNSYQPYVGPRRPCLSPYD
ncbi:BA14K family protein [Rhizobium leguminosarum]|uniref:BA14K family protein n=1 Tax=Rhizobium leguminosarum TaxID=384 RepID=UPI003D7BC018